MVIYLLVLVLQQGLNVDVSVYTYNGEAQCTEDLAIIKRQYNNRSVKAGCFKKVIK